MFNKNNLVTFFMTICIMLCVAFPVYADVDSLPTYTDSNASVMSLNDRNVSTFSSVGTVTSTVDLSHTKLYVRLINTETGMHEWVYPIIEDDGSYAYKVPNGYVADAMGFALKKNALPLSGVYRMQVDHSSVASWFTNGYYLNAYKHMPNVKEEIAEHNITPHVEEFSGDFYSDFIVQLGSLDEIRYYGILTEELNPGSVLAGWFEIAFTASNENPDYVLMVNGYGNAEYEDNMYSSISNLASSVDEVSEGIEGVTEAIQNLAGAMEPHYSNVLTQLHHITEQLHAFWDQQYNLHHVPMMNKLDSILNAILNLDDVFENALKSVTDAINKMSSDIQSKLNDILYGFNNDELSSSSQELSGALSELEEYESIVDEIAITLDHLELPEVNYEAETFNALAIISQLFDILFFESGKLSLLFSISLSCFVCSICFGIYRFKG